MINDSFHPVTGVVRSAQERSPILIVPYMWIGDFVRCHSVVKVLQARWEHRPIDFLTSQNAAPLLDYMPGVRKGIVCDLPRGRIALRQHRAVADRLKAESYGSALIMLRTWKAALAPYLAGIPERTGFFGEFRFLLLNDLRWGERQLERMIDRCAALALPRDAPLPDEWPLPELVVSADERAAWLGARGLRSDGRRVVALCPGAVGRGKRWPESHFAELARQLGDDGVTVWLLGSPYETAFARAIVAAAPGAIDLTGPDLRNAVIALAAADVAVANDSGLMHVSAALGTPTIGLFGPTSPRLWAPLNPLAAALEPDDGPKHDARRAANVSHRRTADIAPTRALDAVRAVLAQRA
jgi:heptosyltransferase-2